MSEETLDRIAGGWQIFQLRRGHRFSSDDQLTAWKAASVCPSPGAYADLGSGIGSVAMQCLHLLSSAPRVVTVEVQELSWSLARRSWAHNGVDVDARLGDLREVQLGREFELITGSPPYIPVGSGVLPQHPQKAGARFELKGDVFDYCEAAARALLPGGRFVFCHSGVDARPEQAIPAAGLTLLQRQDVIFGPGKPPTIALFVCGWEGERQDVEPLVIRDQQGQFSPEYLAIRQLFAG
jgi:tRNA1Val (adenine37-N6)-methyltransferase